jgi:hypothetical protein
MGTSTVFLVSFDSATQTIVFSKPVSTGVGGTESAIENTNNSYSPIFAAGQTGTSFVVTWVPTPAVASDPIVLFTNPGVLTSADGLPFVFGSVFAT